MMMMKLYRLVVILIIISLSFFTSNSISSSSSSSSDDHVLTSTNTIDLKNGVITSPELILDKRLKRHQEHKKYKKEFLLSGFGFEFHLKLKPIDYNFFLNGSDNANKIQNTACFYNGIVNDDSTSTVYINLCHPNKMIGGFHYNFTEYFIEPHDNEYFIEETNIIYLNNTKFNNNLNNKLSSSSSSSNKNDKKKTAYNYNKHILYKFNEKKSKKDVKFDDNKEEEEQSTCGLIDEERYKIEREYEDEIEKKKNDPLKNINFKQNNKNKRVKRDHDDSERSFSEYIAGIEESQVGAAYLELLVVVDSKMSEFYGNGLNDYIYTLLFITTEIFRHASMNNLINVIISDIVYLNDLERNRSAYPTVKDLPDITRNGESSLNSFCKWQTDYRKIVYDEKRIQIDAALLITKEDICKDSSCHTLGMAKMGQLCDVAHSCAIVEDNGLTTPYSIAHEIGHILNMYHTTSEVCKKYPDLKKPSPDDSFTYIMAPLLDLTKKSYRWSRCSIKMLIENLKRDNARCLFNKPQQDRSFYNQRYVNQIMKTIDEGFRYILPGERYGIDEQCKQIRGKNSSACAATIACHVLWCWIPVESPDGVRYACANTHAKWADGTPCSSNKFCISGTCIDRASYQANRIDGQWSHWNEWSDCSRTCGGGVSVSTRKCDNPKPQHGGLFCEGERVRYRSCNTKNCVEGPVQFRDLQCRRGVHDDNIVKRIINEGYNISSTWTSYYHDLQKCKLWCTPLYGGTNVVSFGVNVIDGTKCDRYTSDICVHGKCEKAGCDNVLGSDTEYDNCYVCGGDNSTCRLVTREIEVPIYYEYQPVFEIPPYVSNIKIRRIRDPDLTEMLGNDGYIAARTAISYLFNMGWYILTSTKKGIAVVGGGYLDYIVDNRHEEVVISHGKIQEKIYFQYLGVTAPDGKRRRTKFEISYYESIKPHDSNNNHNNNHNNNNHLDSRNNNPFERNNFRPIIQSLSHDLSQPASWSQDGMVSNENGFCNKECGGVMLVQPACVDDKTNEVVDDKLCHGKTPKTPPKYVPCNTHCKYTAINLNSNCRPVNGSCGAGTMTYNLKCLRQDLSDENMVAEVDASNCEMEKFIRSLKSECHVPCERFEWQKNEGDCKPKCGVGWKRVNYICFDNAENRRANDQRQCKASKPSDYDEPCTTNCYSWRESQWSTCSRTCGIGQRTRSVTCYYENQLVSDDYCQHMPIPATTEDCHLATCQSTWRTGPWSECSAKCGRGERKRSVICTFNDNTIDSNYCDYESRPADTEVCDDTSCSQWVPTAWSDCSVRCGVGVRTRKLYCEMNGQYVHESKCNQATKPVETNECKGTNCAVWKTDEWSQCSVTCGDGLQKRNVYCSNVFTNDVQSCPPNEKPPSQRACQLSPCPRFMWKTGNYSACTTSCGTGWKTRAVFCADLSGQMVDKAICEKQLSQPEPTYFASCRVAFCADWRIGNWSQCSVTCGQGAQARTVTCYDGNRLVADTECDVTIKPPVAQTCNINCPSKRRSEWKILSKSGCSKTCGGGWIIVKSECQYEDGTPSTYCDESSMPTPRIKCNEEACPTWVNGSWSACSTTCGQGIKTRRVACQLSNGTYTSDLNCNTDGKPVDRQQCIEQICPKWSSGPWSECSQVECVQKRSIRCVNSKGQPINDELCDKASKPFGQKECDDISKCDIYKKSSSRPVNKAVLAAATNNKEITRSSVRAHHTVYSACSSPCMHIPGIQTRTTFCRLFNSTEVPLEYCGLTEKVEKRLCSSPKPCIFNTDDELGPCKGECGKTGVREIQVKCRESITQRQFNLSYCNIQKQQASRLQSCIVPACTTPKNVSYFEWKTGPWSKCQGNCGFANKTRVVYCWYNKKNFTVKESYCRKIAKPIAQTPCIDPACGYGWFVSDWSQCSKTCSKGLKTRNVLCIKLSPEGHVLNETSNKCKLTNKPISTMECNYGECNSGFVWKPSSWSQCSTTCGFGYQRRNITCTSINDGRELDQSKCDRKLIPLRYQICYSNCYAKSCAQLKTVFGIYKDGEYNLNVSNSVVKIYCRNMNTNKPLEYITLKSELENYSEIYDKKLLNPSQCNPRWGPRYNIKCDLCSNETVNGYGTTAFSKIRLDIKTLKIISDDFTFSTARYGNPVPFGIAGDCYSSNPECIQGSMHINLNGTNFSFTPNVSWKGYGQNAVSRIYITSDYYKAYGVCGGFCGGCKPDAKVGLQLRVVV